MRLCGRVSAGDRDFGRTYARAMQRYKVMPPCVYWTCKTKKAKGESCRSKNLPEDALKKAIAKAMGMPEFDEAAFTEQVEKIVSVEPRDIILYFHDGRTVRETVIMKGYKKDHYPPEVLAYRAEQRRLKKLREETENCSKDNSNTGNDVTMDVYNHIANKQDIREEVERYARVAGN